MREREREVFVRREMYIMKKQSRCVRRYKQMKNEETSPSTMLNKIIKLFNFLLNEKLKKERKNEKGG